MRTSRRGMVDLIVMIVMIVFVLGMGTLAFLTYDKAQKEKQYLAELRKIPAQQQAEMDAIRARFSEVSNLIGFKGDSAYTSPQAIERLLDEGSRLVPDYYTLSGGSGDERSALSGTSEGTINVRTYDADGQPVEREVTYRVINDTSRNYEPLYHETDNINLRRALGHQDQFINNMFSLHVPAIERQRAYEREHLATVSRERIRASNEAYGGVSSAIENANNEIEARYQALTAEGVDLASALRDELGVFHRIDSQSMRDQRDAAFAEAREAARARATQRRAMDAYRLQADERRLDDSDDPDGYVFMVDERSGWVWISIGQRSDVRLNQTFRVLRPEAGRTSERTVAEIRVKEILEGNLARARVDSVDEDGVYPRSGDLIINPNFSTRQYRDWAFVGDFGGEHSQLNRQQLIELLRSVGYNVQSGISRTTDAVIVGANWMEDEDWQNARDLRLNLATYTEDEVLYFLGVTGPDRTE